MVLAGCGFSGSEGIPLDGGGSGVDAPMSGKDAAVDAPSSLRIDFLPEAEMRFSTGSWTIANTTIELDTSPLAISPILPEMVTFAEGTQRDSSRITILRLKELTIESNATLRVVGSRPFFILAEEVTIAGILDVGARGGIPGPGGGANGQGAGAGMPSLHDTMGSMQGFSGAGGGSFGTRGAAGGRADDENSPAGTEYRIGGLALVAGSSGGASGNCANLPGAGGGALFIYAKNEIRISGQIHAGGGGGSGGLVAVCPNRAHAGAGGGSGGAIWLQAKEISGNGSLAANGGGGGGASNTIDNGAAGEDGKAAVNAVAAGGNRAPNATNSTNGGSGAIQGTPASAVPGLSTNNARGGGGGGGLGRIVIRSPEISSTLQSSPTAVPAPAIAP